MLKVLIALSAFILAAYGAPHGEPNDDESQELTTAGFSPEAVDGILEIADKFASKKSAEGSHGGNISEFMKIIPQINAFMKTQSPADQSAYETFNTTKRTESALLYTNGRILCVCIAVSGS